MATAPSGIGSRPSRRRPARARAARHGRAGRLRSRLRGPATPPRAQGADRRGARQPRDADGAGVGDAARRRCAATARPRCCRPRTARRPRPAPAKCASASGRSASTTSTSICARGWMPRDAAACPACRAWKRPARVVDVGAGRRRPCCPATASPTSVRCQAPTAACARVPADWVVRLPAAIEDDVAAATLLKGITADFLLRDLGHVGRGTRAARPRRGRRRRPAGLRLGADASARPCSAPCRAKQGARRARARLRARDRDAATIVSPMPCSAPCGGADVVVDGLGDAARDENLAALARRGHWISLGQATGALAPLPADALVAKSLTFSRPVVFDYVATPAELARARAARLERARRRHDQDAADRALRARCRAAGARAARVARHGRRADPQRLSAAVAAAHARRLR